MTVPNVLPLDSEHTPVRGLALPRDHEAARTSTNGRVLRDDSPPSEQHTHSEQGTAPAIRTPLGPMPPWVGVLLVVLGTTGGTAGFSTMLSPAVEPERVAAVEQAAAVATATTAAKLAEHDQQIADNAAKTESLDTRTRDSEQRLWAEQIRTSRWMVEAMKDQSVAIAAIAEKLDVKVDLEIEPLGDGR